ncbi:FBH1 helicase, partial [Polypterus senegalus]
MIIDPLPDVYYGLVGERNFKMEGKAYNVQLPEEVLMMIFRYLPAEDLYQNISLVCKSWNAIIRDPLAQYVWAVLVVIVLLSDGVRDIQRLVAVLNQPSSTLSLAGISEILYHIAVLLFAMKKLGINISNSVMPVSEISFTHEQKKILNHDISDGHVVKIMAFAGTGKTFTLIKYAQQRPHLHFLYVAFNKSVAEQAARTFPPNVDCRTIHSMAYQAVGKK